MRFDRTATFVEYLKEFEEREQNDHPEYQDYQFVNELFANEIQKVFNRNKGTIASDAEWRIIKKSRRAGQGNE
ncbi:MAG: hypothetical protein JSV77_06515 [Dehalococcoidales bacterium]|nr:MAG: hypothetical protein JSV77_06515 [Dehalococcoidales bacterium]